VVSGELAELMLAMPMSATYLRVLKLEDLAAAVGLSSVAGWNQTAEDWRMLMNLAPDSCFGIEVGGQLVSTTTLICYGRSLAWIGMVLTKPEHRGRGYARRLVAHALEYADALGIATVKLDATDQGHRLYEDLGFHDEQPIERWSRAGASATTVAPDPSHVTAYAELDRNASGADRSRMLERLAARSQVYTESDAYLLTRAGRVATYLGPCAASDPEAACALITKVVNAMPGSGWSWDLLPKNQDALALASALGFNPQRQLTRMARGKVLQGRDDMVYAIAGFELG
jgi:GNAT superfamily N-acetyltransferase